MLGHSVHNVKLALLTEAGSGKSFIDSLLTGKSAVDMLSFILCRDGDNASYYLKLAAAGVVLLGVLYAAATALT